MITMIVAMDRNRLIGADGGLPWNVPEDLQFFKETTWGKAILMGERTHHSIGRVLPGRINVIASNNPSFDCPGAVVTDDPLAVLEEYRQSGRDIVVIGGAMIYALTLEYVDRLLVSRIAGDYRGDTYFPPFEHLFTLVSTTNKATFVVEEYRRND